MAFHHRKLLLGFYTNMGVRGPAASPHSSAASLSLPQPVYPGSSSISTDPNHHVIQIGLTILACTVGIFLFFFTLFKVLANHYSGGSHFTGRSSPIIFDLNGDSRFSDDEGPTIDHPIWFIRTVGLSQSVIDSITVCKYRKDEGLIDGTECPVCLSEFEQDESLKLLPKCNHAFHVACIDKWLGSHMNCPLCRAPVVRETAPTEESLGEAASDVSGGEDEESQMGLTLEDSGGLGSYRVEEGGSSGLAVGDDGSVLLEIKDGGYTEMVPEKTRKNSLILTDSAMNGHEDEGEIQAVRRSVSVDSGSASLIYGAVFRRGPSV